jgi:hypothetical protein
MIVKVKRFNSELLSEQVNVVPTYSPETQFFSIYIYHNQLLSLYKVQTHELCDPLINYLAI